MIFGWPYAMHHFKSGALQWINTSLWKRLIRVVIGISVAIAIDVLFEQITRGINDVAFKFFFGHCTPALITSFWIFGICPIVCKWCHLVLSEEDLS